MMRPKSVIAAEAAQTPEVKAAGKKAHAALNDQAMSDAEANAIILAYNAMSNAVAVCTREQFRKAWPNLCK
jgi:hypothetical protein